MNGFIFASLTHRKQLKKEAFTTKITIEAKETLYSLKSHTGKTIAELIEEMVTEMDERLKNIGA